jgi:hypothetical protein
MKNMTKSEMMLAVANAMNAPFVDVGDRPVIMARPGDKSAAQALAMAADRLYDAAINVEIVLRQIKEDCLCDGNYQTDAGPAMKANDHQVYADAIDSVRRLRTIAGQLFAAGKA